MARKKRIPSNEARDKINNERFESRAKLTLGTLLESTEGLKYLNAKLVNPSVYLSDAILTEDLRFGNTTSVQRTNPRNFYDKLFKEQAARKYVDQKLEELINQPNSQPVITRSNLMTNKNVLTINLEILHGIVDKGNDEFDKLINGDMDQTSMAQALREVAEQEKKEKIQRAAGEIRKVLQVSEDVIAGSVASIRSARRTEKMAMAKLKQIELAKQYGMETMNFLPLTSALMNDCAHAVPDNWKPSKAKKK